MLVESENQFPLARAALSAGRGTKGKFLSFACMLCFLSAAAAVSSAHAQLLRPPISDNRPLKILSVTPAQSSVGRYGKLEIQISFSGTYSNGFDPDQVAVDAEFTAPNRQIIRVPGFYFQDYSRALKDGREVLTPKGRPGWRVRFSPVQLGEYRAVITVRDSTGAVAHSRQIPFKCVASNNPGFIRRSATDNRYFAFDDGKGYIPVGANVCWANARGTFCYDEWLPAYAKAGCNYFRAWLGPWRMTFALEHNAVGKFDLANAWRLDYVLDLAARNGLYAMLCLDSFNELRKNAEGGFGYWNETPHNAARGGPLKQPREFWTNPAMLRLYKNKLRYVVARYGWNPHVMSWEFWNEVDIVSPSAYIPAEVKQWHAQMSDFLRSMDPWKHLQTTSFGGSEGKPEIDSLPQIDYVQTHNYGSRDVAASLARFVEAKEKYNKPNYVAEFGTDTKGPDGKVDPDGTALHNGIWSVLLSGSAGSAMLWWWDSFIQPFNMYHHYAALTRFIKGIDFPKQHFEQIKDASFAYLHPPAEDRFRDLELDGNSSWTKSLENQPTTVAITNGIVRMSGPVSGVLHGLVNHKDKHNPLTFALDQPRATKVRIVVGEVSGCGGAHLIAGLDGKRVTDKDMPDTNPPGQHKNMSCYSGDYVLEVPAGKHTLKVENIGKDWLLVHYVLEGAERVTRPDLRLFGLRGHDVSLLWIQNSRHSWSRIYTHHRQPNVQPPSVLAIPDWPAGSYRITFYDTYAGKSTATQDIELDKPGLQLELPQIAKDIALRVDHRK